MKKFRPGRLLWRLGRAFRWGIVIFRQKYIDDYAITLEVFIGILIETANYFEQTNITGSSLQDAKRMRLCVKLLMRYRDEYYTDQLCRLPGELRPIEVYEQARNKEQRCLELACRIISQNIGGWWQ